MVMGTHPLTRASHLGARIMLTSDFATVGGYGYPELFQTGESYHGQPLHTRTICSPKPHSRIRRR